MTKNIDVEVPELVPVIYSRQSATSDEIRYARLEKIGSEVWATFDPPDSLGALPEEKVKATASVVAALRNGMGELLGRFWITAIVVRLKRALRSRGGARNGTGLASHSST